MRRLLASALLVTCVLGALSLPVTAARTAAAKVTITYWTHVNPPSQAVEKKLVARYEALHPGVTIDYLPLAFNSLPTKLTTAVAGGGGPDLFNLFQSFVPGLVQRQFVVPVDFKAFGVGTQAGFAARYLPSTVQGFTFNGKVYGVPHEISNFAFWINQSEFKAAGLNPAKDFPTTWDQVAALGKKLTLRKSGKVVQEGISLPLYNALRDTLVLDALTRQAGGLLFSADGKKAYLTSPAALKALGMWSDLVHVHKINDPALGPTASTDNLDLFGNGTAAMTNVGGSWFIDFMKAGYPKGYNAYMVGPEPHFAGGPKVGADLYGFGLFVTSTSKQQAATWQFARFLADNGGAYFNEAGVWLGDKATLAAARTPHWNVFKTSFGQGNFLPPLTHFNEISAILERAIERVVLNGATPSQSLKQAQQEVQPLL
ncbi:MAG: extracellular solute-binding protein [Chloroflexota bacterium]